MAKSKTLDSNSPRTGFETHAGLSDTRALTVRGPGWQSWQYNKALLGMAGLVAALLLLGAPCAGLAKPARGGLDGPIGTLHRGDYLCEEAGDALGEAGVHQPAEDFSILHDSVYRTNAGRGSYLLTGKLIIMTSGPKNGERFRRLSDGFLRQLGPDGAETTLRCIRRVLNNQR